MVQCGRDVVPAEAMAPSSALYLNAQDCTLGFHPSLGFLSVLAGKDLVRGVAGRALLVGLSCSSYYDNDP